MKFTLSPEIYTDKFEESRQFYCDVLGFVAKETAAGFQSMEGFAVLVHPSNPECELYVCIAQSPFVHEIFHPAYEGKGLILQVEVDSIDELHDKAKAYGAPIVLDIIEDPGNGRHFALKDPNGILIDIAEFNNGRDN